MTERKLTLEDLQKQAQKLVREEKDIKIQEIKNHIAQEKQKEDYEKYGSVIFEDKDEIVNDIVNKYLKRKVS